MSSLHVDHRRRAVSLPTALWATAGTLCAALVLEVAFYGHGGHDALSDIPGRYFAWNVHPTLLPYGGPPIEYPVVVGYVTWMTAWIGPTATAFFVVNGALSVGLGLVMTVLLYERGGERIWRWALGVPLALYAFHNWDLLAMVFAVAGLLAYDRKRYRRSGALLALGASTKVFPALMIPPLAVMRWRAGDRRGAVELVGASVVMAVLLNGPIAVGNWSSWVFPASFQGGRTPTWGSLWHWLFRCPGAPGLLAGNVNAVADGLSMGALLAGLVVISMIAVRRHLDALSVGAAVVGLFLLTNKVYSPNYDLWLLPFFVVVPVSRRIFLGFVASATAIFVLVYGYLHDAWSVGFVTALLPWLVLVHALMIAAVIVAALRTARSSNRVARSASRSTSIIRGR